MNEIKETYAELLKRLYDERGSNKKWTYWNLTGFSMRVGSKYNQKLLVVGRAVNGWGESFRCEQLDTTSSREAVIEKFMTAFTDSPTECPMEWLSKRWGSKDQKYNAKTSKFWNTVSRIYNDLEQSSSPEQEWIHHVAWSNLYKIAPAGGGNPPKQLMNQQKETCVEILYNEIREIQPKRIVFLTGMEWVDPFLSKIKFVEERTQAHRHGIHCGRIFNGAKVIIMPHPQGKTKEVVTSAIAQSVQY